jgi:predicted metal-dependent peptidase
MNEERKLQKAKITLMRDPRFALLSGILMVGKTGVDENTPTARTNGRDEWYGRKFVKDLSDAELMFVVAHENYHKMYRHLTTWKKLHDIDHRLANQACDYVINLQLRNLDSSEKLIAMPKYKDGLMRGKPMGLVDGRFANMNVKQVFDILREEQEEGGGGEEGDEGVEGDEGGGGEDGGFDDHDWGEAKDMTEEEKKELERDIDQAIRQGIIAAKRAGEGAGGIDRELAELLEPKVNWREVLRDFVKATCNAKDKSSWRKVNRRFLSSDVYMPSLVGEKIGSITIAIDTSGSIGSDEMSEFLSEVKAIAEEVNPSQVDLLYWDCEVAGHEVYEGSAVSDIINATKPRGGGGTSPSCVSEYMKEKNMKPECIVVLTDGYVGSDWGTEWNAPVLWCIVGGNDVVAPNGKTVHIKE